MTNPGLGGRTLGLGLGRTLGTALPSPVAPWYRAGGAPMPVAAYQPLGASSLTASYVNVANPDAYNAAPGIAPAWAAATGWTVANAPNWLNTGVVPAAGYSWIVRLANFSGNNAALMETRNTSTTRFGCLPAWGGAACNFS